MSKIRDSELYFLVLHWLKSGPCQGAAEALREELQALSLLPSVPSLGPTVRPDYPTLCRLFSHVPPSALRELVEECVERQSEDIGNRLERALSILEATGSLSFIPSVRTQLTPSTVVVPPPSRTPNFFQRLFQRECAFPKRPLRNGQLIENLTAHVYEQMQHVKTIRGHRKAVYCVALDQSGRFALTGADDGIIKIWNLRIGLLKMTCRGHLGEITDLKINCNDTLFASCSTDGTSRVWSLQEETLGHHVQAMLGHQQGVTFVSFHPVLPHALLSVSMDGTCRLWHAMTGIEVLRLKPLGRLQHFYNREAFEKPLDQAIGRQVEIQFAPEETNVNIGLTCCAFSPSGEHFAVSSQSGRCFVWHWDVTGSSHGIDFTAPLEKRTWPDVASVAELAGHEKCVPLLQFNHHGTALCTASSDGHVKIWKPMNGKRRNSSPDARLWRERWSLTLPDPLPCPTYNHRRRKTVPECNQIAWSCNDQFIMAAYSCSVIMVWNATSGEEENILYGGHTDSPVHVLVAHPTDPKLCFSAGYDGMLILWDVVNGRKIKALSSQDTHPGRWRWADPIQFIDGCFQQDGMGIVVSDVAGQFHLYDLGRANPVMRRTPYDQFFLYDYDKVIIGEKGEPIDTESGEPQHIHRTRFSFVDITEEPYEPFVQEVLHQGTNLMMLPPPSDPPQTPSSLLILPPTISAALWLADETGLGQQATATRVSAAQQRQIALMQEQGGTDEIAEYLPPVQVDELPEIAEAEMEEDSDGSEYTPDEGEQPNSPFATRRSERIQTRSSEVSAPRRRRIPTRQHPEIAEETVDVLEAPEPDLPDVETEEEEALYNTSDVVSEESVTSEEEEVQLQIRRRVHRHPRQRLQRPPRMRRRYAHRDRSPLRPAPIPRTRRPERRSLRIRQMNRTSVSQSVSEDVVAAASPQTLQTQPSARSRRAARRAAIVEAAEIGDTSLVQYSGREIRSYQWLSEPRRPAGYYAPQAGDAVVYFSRMHGRFCEHNPRLATQLDAAFVDDIRYAEPCEVLEVKYEIFREGSHAPTVARVKLRLMEESRFGPAATFQLYIPPPYFGHEEFLISRTVFQNSMNCDLYIGQEVKVFYFGEATEWWVGEIVEDQKPQAECDSLWECEELYHRYLIEWLEVEKVQPELLSPWEMVANFPGEEPRAQASPEERLDGYTKNMLLGILAEATDRTEAEHFRETLAPESAFIIPGRIRREDRKLYYNQIVPLPMSLKLITSRVESGQYYTSMEAFKADVHLIVENAHLFTEPTSDVSLQADALERFILQSLMHTLESSASPSSEDELFEVSRNYHRSSASNGRMASGTAQPSGEYQIRTRGMAKRDRQSEEHHPYQRTTRRRRYA